MNYLKKLGWVLLAVVALKFTIHLVTFGLTDFDLSQTSTHVGMAVVGFTLASWDWKKMQDIRGWIRKKIKGDK